jgi:hypothetical protein
MQNNQWLNWREHDHEMQNNQWLNWREHDHEMQNNPWTSMISMITSCSNYYIFAKLYQDAKISLKIPKGVIRSHKSKDRHVIQWPEEKRTMI